MPSNRRSGPHTWTNQPRGRSDHFATCSHFQPQLLPNNSLTLTPCPMPGFLTHTHFFFFSFHYFHSNPTLKYIICQKIRCLYQYSNFIIYLYFELFLKIIGWINFSNVMWNNSSSYKPVLTNNWIFNLVLIFCAL